MEHDGMIERRKRSGLYIKTQKAQKSVVYFYIDWPSKRSFLLTEEFGKALRSLGNYDFTSIPFYYQSNHIEELEKCDADIIITSWPASSISKNELARLLKIQQPLVLNDRNLSDIPMHCFYVNSGHAALCKSFFSGGVALSS